MSLAGFAFIAVLGAASRPPPAAPERPPVRCSIIVREWLRRSGAPLVALRAMRDSVIVPERSRPTSVDSPAIYGRFAQVLWVRRMASLTGGGQSPLPQSLARKETAVLVSYSLAADCGRAPERGRAGWWGVGDPLLVAIPPRADSLGVPGHATFDLQPGFPVYNPATWRLIASETSAEARAGRSHWPPWRGPMKVRVLTLQEFGDLYAVLPTYCAWERGEYATAMAPLLAWARRHPELARAEPARMYLRLAKEDQVRGEQWRREGSAREVPPFCAG